MTTAITPELREAYYARVAPLYGEALRGRTFGIVGDDRTLEIALLLARCGVLRFAAGESSGKLTRLLYQQNPLEDRFEFVPHEEADLVLFGPGANPASFKSPAVRLSFPGTAIRTRLDVIPAGEACEPITSAWPYSPFDRADAINRTAALCRALLLRNLRCEPAEISSLIGGKRKPSILIGHERWPWWIRTFECEEANAFLKSAPKKASVPEAERRGRVLNIGCGSLGSVAAVRLAPLVDSLILCDPERVAIENPVRQEFSIDDVGEFKAEALARHCRALGAEVSARVRCEEDSNDGERTFEKLLGAERPDLVILTTGTGAEFMMTDVLRRRRIPHVAGRCYARARYFEIIAVDGPRGPCYHCLREQINTGPAPSLTPEQHARYDPNYRPGELNAEPASIIDSGGCAEVLARIAFELLRSEDLRPEWLRQSLAQDRNCFIGANHAEMDSSGRWAYGLDLPGKVTTYGIEDVAGVRTGERCEVCGRVF